MSAITEVMSFSTLRSNMATTLDKVNADDTSVLVTRQKGEPAVIMSFQSFKAYEETAYLMASQANAQRLSQSIAEAENNKLQSHDMIDT